MALIRGRPMRLSSTETEIYDDMQDAIITDTDQPVTQDTGGAQGSGGLRSDRRERADGEWAVNQEQLKGCDVFVTALGSPLANANPRSLSKTRLTALRLLRLLLCNPDEKPARLIVACIRDAGAMRYLLQALHSSNLEEGDEMRALASNCLLIMANQDEHVLQYLSAALPRGSALSEMISGEVSNLHPHSAELHRLFRHNTVALLARVKGSTPAMALEASDHTMRKLEKFQIVQRTNIAYSPKELLLLIRQHLISLGLEESATCLTAEAQLNAGKAALRSSSSTCRVRSTSPTARQPSYLGGVLEGSQSPASNTPSSAASNLSLGSIHQPSNHPPGSAHPSTARDSDTGTPSSSKIRLKRRSSFAARPLGQKRRRKSTAESDSSQTVCRNDWYYVMTTN